MIHLYSKKYLSVIVGYSTENINFQNGYFIIGLDLTLMYVKISDRFNYQSIHENTVIALLIASLYTAARYQEIKVASVNLIRNSCN